MDLTTSRPVRPRAPRPRHPPGVPPRRVLRASVVPGHGARPARAGPPEGGTNARHGADGLPAICAAVMARGPRRDGVAPFGSIPVGHPSPGERSDRRAAPPPLTPLRRRRLRHPPAARPQGPHAGSADQIRTTNILRTLCDLGALDAAAVDPAVGHVVTTGLASPAALRKAVDRHARRGRPGVPALARRARQLGARRQAGRQPARAGYATALEALRLATRRVPRHRRRVRGRFLDHRQPDRPRVRRLDHARA